VRLGLQRVWLVGYEFGCCGEPFEVGSTVRWEVETTAPADPWLLSEELGDEAPKIDASFSAHRDEDDGFAELEGTVQRIDAVFVRYGLSPGGMTPIAGSGVLVSRTAVPRILADNGDLEFLGYVVDLEVTRVTNPAT